MPPFSAFLRLVTLTLLLAACDSGAPADTGRPNASSSPIAVSAASTIRTLPTVGFNNNVMNSPMEVDAYRDTVATLRPQLLRYPGGTVGDYFDWRTGWVDTTALPADHPWRAVDVLSMPPDAFLSHVQSMEADPLFALNAFASTLDEQLALLQHVEALGAPVRYVELGNEYYFGQPRFVEAYPTAEDYGAAMKPWLDSLEAHFPEAKACVIGSSPSPAADARRLTWNDRLFPVVEDAHAACFHPYFSAPSDALTQSDPVALLMAVPYQRWRNFRDEELAALPSDWEAWLTEYNLFEIDDGGVRTTWVHGLMTAFYTALLMQDERVTVLLAHQLAGNRSFAAVEVRAPFTALQPYLTTAYGNAMRMLYTAMRGHEQGRPLTFAPLPETTVQTGGTAVSYPRLIGWQFGADTALLLNVHTEAIEIELDALSPDGTFRQLHAADALAPLVNARDLIVTEGALAGPLTLPPLSMTRLSMASN